VLTIEGIMKHRKAGKLPTGEKITLLKVGGRTSAVVPSLQKKTGAVAGDVDEKPVKGKADEKPAKGKAAEKVPKATAAGKKRKVKEEDEEPVKAEKAAKVEGTRRRSTRNA
jgi:formamidopyrimidine-DNA glycosylase